MVDNGSEPDLVKTLLRLRGDGVIDHLFLLPRNMLTGDENIVNVQFSVQYKISDHVAYLFNVVAPGALVRNAAEAAMRKFFPKPPSTSPAPTYYKGVLTEANARLCRDFVAQNKAAFDNASARYGVPPSIAVSLLFVETRLGKVLADVPENAFYTLASMGFDAQGVKP